MILYNRSGMQTGETFSIDESLTQQGQAADSKITGDTIKECYDSLDPEIWVTRDSYGYLSQFGLVAGNIDNSTGEFIPSNTHNVTDFIPVIAGQTYITRNTGYVYYYDESKSYINKSSYPIDKWECPNTAVFVRVVVSNANKDIARFLPSYLFGKKNINGKIYTGITENADVVIEEGFNGFATDNNIYFKKTDNQFNYYNDWVQFSQNGRGTNANDGRFVYNDGSDQTNNFDSTKAVSPVKYFEVDEGQTLVANKGWQNGAYYNESHEYIGTISEAYNESPFFYAPAGCKYVRLNFKSFSTVDELKGLTVITLNNSAPNKREPVIKYPKPMYQIDGNIISNNYLDKVVPTMQESDLLSALKCLSIREANKREHAFRYGTFNIYVGNLGKGYDTIKKMLMDLGVDFCGFQEVYNTPTLDLASFLHSWQFPYGFYANNTDGEEPIDKTFVSAFPVLSYKKLELPSSLGLQNNSTYLNCKVQLPRHNDVYEPVKILSVYVVHLPITSTSMQEQVATAILDEIANDNSDFVIIAGDMNDMGYTEQTKHYWKTFEAGGFRPVIPISTKTITSDTLERPSEDPSKNWRSMCLDQFCVSSNIQVKRFGVENTKDRYWNTECNKVDNEYCLSDHDFVWADFVFDYETPRTGLQS